MDRELFTQREAMRLLRVDRPVLRKWLADGTLSGFVRGRCIRITSESVRRLVNENGAAATRPESVNA